MQPVKYGRTWDITTKAEYDAAMEELDGNDFCAEMSDDYSVTRSEQAEVFNQRAEVIRQAKERGADLMGKSLWVCFYYFDGARNRLLLKYSLEHESPGERRETRNLLAEENRISPDDIVVKLEWK